MGFFDWVGEIQAEYDNKRRNAAAVFKKQQLAESLNRVIELDAQRSQAQKPQIPLRATTWERPDELAMAQQMKLAGIDSGAISRNKLDAAKLQAFQQSMGGVGDNAYALGNLANGLDVSPVRQSGGITYNRFDATDPILKMTEAVKADGRMKSAQAAAQEAKTDALVNFLKDPYGSPVLKVDAANDKAITKTDKAILIGADGKKRYYNQVLQPDESWRYTPAEDVQGNELRVPAEASETSLGKNMTLLAQKLEISEGDALKILTNTRDKSNTTVYGEAVKIAANSPKTAYGANNTQVKTMADDLFRMMRPGEALPSEMVNNINRGSNEAPAPTSDSEYQSADDVKAAYQAGTITREAASKILKTEFGYQ